jgi:hypothetical protein
LRLWSIHPKYLDKIGLLALWREGLLAQKVLKGKTKGYANHPQLLRFKNHNSPLKAVGSYLLEVWKESSKRGFDFNKGKIGATGKIKRTKVNRGQLEYEFNLLRSKLKRRNPRKYKEVQLVKDIEPHPTFKIIAGKIESWEKRKFDRKIQT